MDVLRFTRPHHSCNSDYRLSSRLSYSKFFIDTVSEQCAYYTVIIIFYAGRSGLVVARLPAAREGPGSNRAADNKFVFSRKSLRYAALGTGCTLTAVPRSTQPSTLRGTVNEYQPHG